MLPLVVLILLLMVLLEGLAASLPYLQYFVQYVWYDENEDEIHAPPAGKDERSYGCLLKDWLYKCKFRAVALLHIIPNNIKLKHKRGLVSDPAPQNSGSSDPDPPALSPASAFLMLMFQG